MDKYLAGIGKIAERIAGSQHYALGLAFTIGLLLGWIVIGWWLWPVRWVNTRPSDLQPRYQATFVRLVAEDYWRTHDLSRAEDLLASWEEEALSNLLVIAEGEAASPDAREHLAALREALELPGPEPLLGFLFRQKLVIWGVVVAMLPLIAAIGFAVSPYIAQLDLELSREEQSEALSSRKPGLVTGGAAERQQVPEPHAAQEGQVETPHPQPSREDQEGQTEGPAVSAEAGPGVTPAEAGPEAAPSQSARAAGEEAEQSEQEQDGQAAEEKGEATEIREGLEQMQQRLERLPLMSPEIQQPVAEMQERLDELLGDLEETEAVLPELSDAERQARLERIAQYMLQVQEQIRGVTNLLPEEASPEARAEIRLMHKHLTGLVQKMQQMKRARDFLEQKAEEELDLEDVTGMEDVISDTFQSDDVLDPLRSALADDLPDVVARDLSERCTEALGRLQGRGSSSCGPAPAQVKGNGS